jgi:hypothetical protein
MLIREFNFCFRAADQYYPVFDVKKNNNNRLVTNDWASPEDTNKDVKTKET